MSNAGRGRQPTGNRIVMAVLRSRWHRLLSGSLARITVRGRRTGQVFALPVQYARTGDRLVLLPAHAERKRWWRNLDGGAEVRILLAGRDRPGRAQLVRAGTPAFRDAAAEYGRRFPRAARTAASSQVLVTVALTAAAPGAAPSRPGRAPATRRVPTGPPAGRRSRRSPASRALRLPLASVKRPGGIGAECGE
ncbi:MAG TPA: nitroreductase/quinone reductase family protein [Mycobacteriales bacterium]